MMTADGMENRIFCGDSRDILKTFPDNSADCCVTSPPYYRLRDYGVSGQTGSEDTPEAYIENLLSVFSETRRVLKDSGTLWVVIGDSYNGSGKNTRNTKELSYKQNSNTGSWAVNKATLCGLPSKSLLRETDPLFTETRPLPATA